MLVLNCCVSRLESCPMLWHASLYCARRCFFNLAIVFTDLITGVAVRSFSNSRFWGRHWGPGAPETRDMMWNSSPLPHPGATMECKAHGGLGPGGSGLSGFCILRQEQYNHMLHMYAKMSRFRKLLLCNPERTDLLTVCTWRSGVKIRRIGATYVRQNIRD